MPGKGNFLFTSESVTEGHPDKMADQISDAILDAMLAQDPRSRVACETMVTTGMVVVAGEITTTADVDIKKVVRKTVEGIGYTDPAFGFDHRYCAVMVALDEQSPDIAQGVNTEDGLHKDQGAGDQGLMFGYATNETESLMPLPIDLAHKLTARLAEVRRSGEMDYIGPDGKSQVTIEYRDGKATRVEAVVIAIQHRAEVGHAKIKEDVLNKVIRKIIPADMFDDNTKVHVNETGVFILGGPHADCGLTGRKIIVDTYGGWARHGGGAFSGKDPSKVDRSATYAARWVAKNVVAAGLADQAEVQVAYAIGVAQPVSIHIDTFGTAKIPEDEIVTAVRKHFDLRPQAIIGDLDLLRPVYQQTAAYGHFGRSDFSWENTDRAEGLRSEFADKL